MKSEPLLLLFILLFFLCAVVPPVSASESYIFTGKWGVYGSGDGQVHYPEGIAITAAGSVYLVDTMNNRVQKFTSTGTFVSQWGVKGTANGQFDTPRECAVDNDGNVYVVDSLNNRIQKFTSSGTFVTMWGEEGSYGPGQFSNPMGIAVSNAGDVYVVDRDHHRVQKFTSTGGYVSMWGDLGTGNGQFYSPTGIATDRAGNVYVADSWNHRIQKFSSTGTYVTQWGTWGNGDGQFNNPMDIAVDGTGYVYVTDRVNHRVQKFTSTGTFVTKWGEYGSNDGQFDGLWGIAVDSAGTVHVVDTVNNRVQTFAKQGTTPVPTATPTPTVTPTLTVPTLKPVPGASGLPQDLDRDGRCEDVNGNGREDFADIVLYFNQMAWIAGNEPLEAFDYNDNGRIDFADVVRLFTDLSGGPTPTPMPITPTPTITQGPFIAQIVNPSTEPQTIRFNDTIAVTIPGGVLASPSVLLVQSVTSPPAPPREGDVPLTSIEVSLGDQHEFSSEIVIEAPYDPARIPAGSDTLGGVTGGYWDAGSAAWVLVPATIDEDRHVVTLATRHLTVFEWFIGSTVHKYFATAGHVVVYYDTNDDAFARYFDTAHTFADARAMAVWCSQVLEDQYSTYTAMGFDPANPSLDGNGKVVVHIGKYPDGAEWSWSSGHIYVSIYPTVDPPDEIHALRQDLKHDLFHAVQNSYITVPAMLNNRWWMDATADYAAGEWPPITPDYFVKPIDSSSEPHMYQTAGLIQTMLRVSGATFPELWDYSIASGGDIYTRLDPFMKTHGSTLGKAYLEFAREHRTLLPDEGTSWFVDGDPDYEMNHQFTPAPKGGIRNWTVRVDVFPSFTAPRLVGIGVVDGETLPDTTLVFFENEDRNWTNTPCLLNASDDDTIIVHALNVADSTANVALSVREPWVYFNSVELVEPNHQLVEGRVIVSHIPIGIKALHLECSRFGHRTWDTSGFDPGQMSSGTMSTTVEVTGDRVEVPVYIRRDQPPPNTGGTQQLNIDVHEDTTGELHLFGNLVVPIRLLKD